MEDHSPAGHVAVGQDAGCLQFAAQQLVDGGPRGAQRAVSGLDGAADPATELLPFHAHKALALNGVHIVVPGRVVVECVELPIELRALSIREANASRPFGPQLAKLRQWL